MKFVHLALVSLSLFFALGALSAHVQAQIAPGQLFIVDFNGDSVDVNVGDGQCLDAGGHCTLRAAVDEANANAANSDAILFALPAQSVIDLTLGELNITSPITIVGPGPRRLTVQRSTAPGTPDFRVFHILGHTTIMGMTIRNGRTMGGVYGGGIFVEQGQSLNLAEVAVRDNLALNGGGIANRGTVSITRSLFTGNRGNLWAGAIYNVNNTNPSVRIMNSTITGNSAGSHGAISNQGTLLIINSTITHNSAEQNTTGIASFPEATVRVLNSVIGSDSSPTLTCLGGQFISLGNNIITDARNSSGFVNGVNNDQVSDSNAINPLLGPLTDNGGQTDTRALLAGSPAINAGSDCVTNGTCSVGPAIRLDSDQRSGFSRRFSGTVDIGAFEYDSTFISGIVSFGFGVFNRPARYGGSIAVLTNALTVEKRYAAMNPFGSGSFQSVPRGVYLLEIKSKRDRLSLGPLVVDMNDFPFLSPPGPLLAGRGTTIKLEFR